ncbi:zinc-dependent metalloprotease [Aestuariivivens sediminis]|uniref:zinc-dependent metalloprotease n=1 Tax=Aestuariivivens sediminis TaxID=2913557 RepID=UPI001F59CC65|nr:zinc-dependent metalloprotease [Aestuariivivens sediminis]
MKTILPLLAAVFFNISFFAQDLALCGTDAVHKKLMKTDPSYKSKFLQSQEKINDAMQAKIAAGKMSTTQYTIPIIVHVIHLGESVGTGTNISDAQVQSAIDNLNVAFSGSGSYLTDINVDFVLAQRDGECNASTGIIRVDGSSTSDYATQGLTYNGFGSDNEEAVKSLSKYPGDEFYNIWIVSEINDNGAGSGTQGYAYFPGASPDIDGAVIVYNAFGYDPSGVLGFELKSYTNRNVTAIHELGHAFNLFHTFEGDDSDDDDVADQCPINTDPTSDGDACADTSPHRRDDGNCGDSGETCAGIGTDLADVVTNFMAYSSDVCQVKFSVNQRDRIRTVLEGVRWSLINSSGGLPPENPPSAALSSTPTTQSIAVNSGIGVYGLSLDSTTYSSGDAEDDGGYRDNSCSRFNLGSNTMYTISVRTGSINNEHVKVYIDYNNNGDFNDSGEEIFSSTNNLEIHSGNFTIPAISPNVIANTPLWVRVISDFASTPTNTITGPDFSPQYGQVEDFSVFISNSLNVKDHALTKDLITIVPNPNRGRFSLKYDGNLSLKKLSIFNMIGREVMTLPLRDFERSKTIDLSYIQSGMYFITIMSDSSQATKKISIK